uniref:Uncharacterized protein n=1 Tax=Scinaia undulata TaxID=1884664 RepID=A0A1G4NXD0_9FLOR|nr:Hypothetical protein ycf53 [Scinaia undulata]SCW23307.1 Hypothetical protein ycf53 [Scinaia undulata]
MVENCQRLCELFQSDDSYAKRRQLDLVDKIFSMGQKGQNELLSLLLDRYDYKNNQIDCVDGLIFELLSGSDDINIRNILENRIGGTIIPLKSVMGIDYKPLQHLLVTKQFQEADQLTQLTLCTLAQASNDHTRSWLYFTDIANMPAVDLFTVDRLWQVHSRGLFGLSIQRQIWLSTNSNWEKFWHKIGWKVNNANCRYPQDFIWNITAPAGHLPLFNQLRGVQVLAALFEHPAWTDVMS